MIDFARAAIIAVFALVLAMVIGCTPNDPAVKEISAQLENQDNVVEVRIFYPSTEMIVEEPRDIEKSKYGPAEVIRQIFEAKRGGNKLDPVMPDTKVIDVKVDNGMAIVNFERSVLDFAAPEINQQLVVAAVVKTLEQFPEIDQVKFQVEGLETGKLDDKDVEDFWGDVTLKSQPWKVR